MNVLAKPVGCEPRTGGAGFYLRPAAVPTGLFFFPFVIRSRFRFNFPSDLQQEACNGNYRRSGEHNLLEHRLCSFLWSAARVGPCQHAMILANKALKIPSLSHRRKGGCHETQRKDGSPDLYRLLERSKNGLLEEMLTGTA